MTLSARRAYIGSISVRDVEKSVRILKTDETK